MDRSPTHLAAWLMLYVLAGCSASKALPTSPFAMVDLAPRPEPSGADAAGARDGGSAPAPDFGTGASRDLGTGASRDLGTGASRDLLPTNDAGACGVGAHTCDTGCCPFDIEEPAPLYGATLALAIGADGVWQLAYGMTTSLVHVHGTPGAFSSETVANDASYYNASIAVNAAGDLVMVTAADYWNDCNHLLSGASYSSCLAIGLWQKSAGASSWSALRYLDSVDDNPGSTVLDGPQIAFDSSAQPVALWTNYQLAWATAETGWGLTRSATDVLSQGVDALGVLWYIDGTDLSMHRYLGSGWTSSMKSTPIPIEIPGTQHIYSIDPSGRMAFSGDPGGNQVKPENALYRDTGSSWALDQLPGVLDGNPIVGFQFDAAGQPVVWLNVNEQLVVAREETSGWHWGSVAAAVFPTAPIALAFEPGGAPVICWSPTVTGAQSNTRCAVW